MSPAWQVDSLPLTPPEKPEEVLTVCFFSGQMILRHWSGSFWCRSGNSHVTDLSILEENWTMTEVQHHWIEQMLQLLKVFFFLSTASSNIKSEFLGQLQLKSTYFRTQFFVSLAMLWHHITVLTLKNRAWKGVLILFAWFIFADVSMSLLGVVRVKHARESEMIPNRLLQIIFNK